MNWISIKDEKPDDAGLYLVYAKSEKIGNSFIRIAWYEPETSEWSILPDVWKKAITHWTFLPLGPEESE